MGSQLRVPSAVARGAVHVVGGSACPHQVRTLVAEPVHPRRVAAAAGEWRVGVARGRRPGTLIVTGWRAVLSHRDPRGGGGGGARPWQGECAALGPGPGSGPAGSPGVWAAPPSDGVAARAGTGHRVAAAQPPA